MARIHPALRKALQRRDIGASRRPRAGARTVSPPATLDVVIHLKPERGQVVDSPVETRAKARALIREAQEASGEKPRDYKVFPNLQTMSVRASPAFLRELVGSKAVASAVPNRLEE